MHTEESVQKLQSMFGGCWANANLNKKSIDVGLVGGVWASGPSWHRWHDSHILSHAQRKLDHMCWALRHEGGSQAGSIKLQDRQSCLW